MYRLHSCRQHTNSKDNDDDEDFKLASPAHQMFVRVVTVGSIMSREQENQRGKNREYSSLPMGSTQFMIARARVCVFAVRVTGGGRGGVWRR